MIYIILDTQILHTPEYIIINLNKIKINKMKLIDILLMVILSYVFIHTIYVGYILINLVHVVSTFNTDSNEFTNTTSNITVLLLDITHTKFNNS